MAISRDLAVPKGRAEVQKNANGPRDERGGHPQLGQAADEVRKKRPGRNPGLSQRGGTPHAPPWRKRTIDRRLSKRRLSSYGPGRRSVSTILNIAVQRKGT